MPEGHEDNSDSNDSEPENHRDQNADDDDCEDAYDNYEFTTVSNQGLPSQAEMDVGGVHNETGDEAEDDDEDHHHNIHNHAHNLIPLDTSMIPGMGGAGVSGDNSMAGGGR